MRIRKEGAEGDMCFGNSEGDFWRDQREGVGQLVKNRLNLWLGEWFLDTQEGTPWQLNVLGKGRQTLYEPALRARVLPTPGVRAITAFQADTSQIRDISVNLTINTAYGVTPLAVVLSGQNNGG
ncbi:hypothetical protein [Entomobacter blattae]|nr:hypothetical protein [Entomobacter blattae]